MRPARDTQGHTRIGLVTITGGTKRKKKKNRREKAGTPAHLPRWHNRDGPDNTASTVRDKRAPLWGAGKNICVCVEHTTLCDSER